MRARARARVCMHLCMHACRCATPYQVYCEIVEIPARTWFSVIVLGAGVLASGYQDKCVTASAAPRCVEPVGVQHGSWRTTWQLQYSARHMSRLGRGVHDKKGQKKGGLLQNRAHHCVQEIRASFRRKRQQLDAIFSRTRCYFQPHPMLFSAAPF